MSVVEQSPLSSKRERVCFLSKQEAQQKEKALLVHPKNKTVNSALRNICFILQRLAQRYVPNTPKTFGDYNELAHCIRLLQEMGLRPPVNADIAAHVSAASPDVVINSLEYRQLRNKTIACLATIADLTEKATEPGTQDYRRGMREGYRRASDIASLFLSDFDAGDVL